MGTIKKTAFAPLFISIVIAVCNAGAWASEQKSAAPTTGRRSYRDMRQHTFNEKEGVHVGNLAISPDGGKIAYVSDENTNPDIFVKGVNSKMVAQETDNPAADEFPAFSPDGNMLAFASKRNGTWDVYLMYLSGGKAPRQLTTGRNDKLSPTWSPGGKKIAYGRRSPTGSPEIWIYDLEKGTFSFLTIGENPAYSPASNLIVFQRLNNKGFFSIWAADDGGAEEVNIITSNTEGYFSPSWSHDGAKIVFISGGKPIVGGKGQASPERAAKTAKGENAVEDTFDITERRGNNIWVINRDGGNLTRLTDNDKGSLSCPKFSRDGRVYFINSEGVTPNIFSVIPEFVTTDAATQPPPAGNAKAGKK